LLLLCSICCRWYCCCRGGCRNNQGYTMEPKLLQGLGSLPGPSAECESVMRQALGGHSHWVRQYGVWSDAASCHTQATSPIASSLYKFETFVELLRTGAALQGGLYWAMYTGESDANDVGGNDMRVLEADHHHHHNHSSSGSSDGGESGVREGASGGGVGGDKTHHLQADLRQWVNMESAEHSVRRRFLRTCNSVCSRYDGQRASLLLSQHVSIAEHTPPRVATSPN
jgi:hypothetical protein